MAVVCAMNEPEPSDRCPDCGGWQKASPAVGDAMPRPEDADLISVPCPCGTELKSGRIVLCLRFLLCELA
jgi:hypothetical protein